MSLVELAEQNICSHTHRKGKYLIHMINKRVIRLLAAFSLSLILTCTEGCSNDQSLNVSGSGQSSNELTKQNPAGNWSVEDGYINASVETTNTAAEEVQNSESSLSVPTYVTKVDNTWFIVDCYHDQIIYSEDLSAPLYEWKVLTKDAKQPHTMASDGIVILVDDTENNRVLVFEKQDSVYVNTQIFDGIGNRPHYTVYDEEDKAFYVWSSTTGEMYIFRHEDCSSKIYLTEIRKAGGGDKSTLDGTYIRSFYIKDGDIYFVSGIGADGRPSGILICDKATLEIKEKIEVPDSMAGMVAMVKEGDYFYITVSTDVAGDQNAATMVRTKDLKGLMKGDFEEIYSDFFVGGGTPYNITEIDDTFFLTEHRLPGHYVWSFRIENNEITDVRAVF
ncbi:hypothetical protein [Butyrivibrio sp. LC3010]|uniref:hypothetical protein n=1 Tax=Butyrivibrio sp. LC3010 TaxID=1280680 RepID=UPI0003FA5951|nr:hypothetical protein [Butyrivibrio sp. LC3010]